MVIIKRGTAVNMINKINESKYKKQLNAVQKQVNTYLNLEMPTKCPYCGGKMVIKTVGDFAPDSGNASMLLCVCEHYNDTCSCSLKVKKDRNGKLIPNGTPADKNLKSMRCEAHYYMDAIIRYQIYNSYDDIYDFLSRQENVQRNQLHMSLLREGRCRSVILDLLNLISMYPVKVRGRVNPYYSTQKGVKSISETDPTAKELLEKVKKQIR